jgi:VIT1/CCC1 family predicted Fe2+/Mn2+ transporter
MYVVTVWLLILPYFLLKNVYLALAGTLITAVLIILGFTFYVSVAQDIEFKERFLEMAGLSLSVATVSFGLGYVVKLFL